MIFQETDINKYKTDIFELFNNRWFLLTSGDYKAGHFNTMTVSWGSMGIMWNKPFVMVVVRPQRFTFEFMEKYDTFTLTSFPEKYRKALNILGSKSGRSVDKIKISGLHPIASTKIQAPAFKEAELVIECSKIYWNDFLPENFLSPQIEENYPRKDYHRIYFGEVFNILEAI